jgi:hypothetical protein
VTRQYIDAIDRIYLSHSAKHVAAGLGDAASSPVSVIGEA